MLLLFLKTKDALLGTALQQPFKTFWWPILSKDRILYHFISASLFYALPAANKGLGNLKCKYKIAAAFRSSSGETEHRNNVLKLGYKVNGTRYYYLFSFPSFSTGRSDDVKLFLKYVCGLCVWVCICVSVYLKDA